MKRKPKKVTTKKAVYKIAKAAARQVVKTQADPLWVVSQYGAYDVASGQWSNFQNIAPGPSNGFIDSQMIKIQQPNAVGDIGNPGMRKDDMVLLSGIKVRLRIFCPVKVKTAKVAVYLALALKPNVAETKYFNTPDQITMLRSTASIRQDLSQLKVLKAQTIKFNQQLERYSTNQQPPTFIWKDIDIWYDLSKKPFKLKFDGTGETDYLNRRFCLCLKPSYQLPVDGSEILMGFAGTVTTYYRDL